MIEQATSPRYSAVICRVCREPIPVPAIVTKMDQIIGSQVSAGSGAARVFQLRCRECSSEKLYRSTQIVEIEGQPKRKSHIFSNPLIARAASA